MAWCWAWTSSPTSAWPFSNAYQASPGAIDAGKEREIALHYVDALSIATPGIGQTVSNLSGGNQQKVVLAKWLSSKPKLLIMDEPTRGIDVGAKAEVHALMSHLAQEGMGILMISSEMPEIIGMSDRVMVMCQGRITGEFARPNLSQEEIMTAATRFLRLDAVDETGAEVAPTGFEHMGEQMAVHLANEDVD